MPENSAHMKRPNPLQVGDTVAIVSPASSIDPTFIDGAIAVLREWGFNVAEGTHARGHHTAASGAIHYSGTLQERLEDLRRAFEDPSVKAILCSRGGYGTMQLLDPLQEVIARNPKWVVGFSDITALHAALHRAGIASIHGLMAKHLTECGGDDACSQALRHLLTGGTMRYEVNPHPCNREGIATAPLVGGNLALLYSMLATPYNMIKPGVILFIEDIAEAIYRTERMLLSLRLAGILPRLAGLVVGQFTRYRDPLLPEQEQEQTQQRSAMYEMISEMVAPYDYPVAFNFPIGHVNRNQPLVEGAKVRLRVNGKSVILEEI